MKEPSPSGNDQIERSRLINRQQLREIIPASDMSVWRWIKAGVFPEPIKIGGRNYWRLADVLAVVR
jgi:predicted DNA-binding transcriptional regulator AlpA